MPQYNTLRWNRLVLPNYEIIGEKTGEKCVVCGLGLTDEFPQDFPDGWKLCCYCRNYMEIISCSNRGLIEAVYKDESIEEKLKELLDKIEKLMTVV